MGLVAFPAVLCLLRLGSKVEPIELNKERLAMGDVARDLGVVNGVLVN